MVPMFGLAPHFRLETDPKMTIVEVLCPMFAVTDNHHTVCLTINHPKNLDNIFIPKTLEKQCAKNKAVKKDIDEWICRAESME